MADALPTPDAPLPDDPAVLQGMIRELLAALAAERHDRQQLENRLDLLLQRVYGPRSEKRPPGPTLFDEFTPAADLPEATEPPAPAASEAAHKSKRPAKDRWGSGGYGGRGRCSAGAWELRVGGALGLGPDVGQ